MENYKDELKQALNSVYGVGNEEIEVAKVVPSALDATKYALKNVSPENVSPTFDDGPDYAIKMAVILNGWRGPMGTGLDLFMSEDMYRQFKKQWNDRGRDFITIKAHRSSWRDELRSITLRKASIDAIIWPVPRYKESRE